MIFAEKWKKELLNKWSFIEQDGEMHYFHPIKMYDAKDYGGRVLESNALYNLYYGKELEGMMVTFAYWINASADVKYWSQFAPLKDKRALKKLSKRVTQALLRGEEKETKNASGYIEKMMEKEEEDDYWLRFRRNS